MEILLLEVVAQFFPEMKKPQIFFQPVKARDFTLKNTEKLLNFLEKLVKFFVKLLKIFKK